MKEINENRVLECYQKYKDTVFSWHIRIAKA